MTTSRFFTQAFAALVLAAGSAAAQGMDLEVQPNGESASRCLTSSVPKPPFPAQGDEAGAVIRTTLTFTAPDAPPAVEITYDNGKPAFVAEVRRFVAGYRLPCLPAGTQAVALQEFQFVHSKPVIAGAVRDPEDDIPEACLAGVKDWPVPSVAKTDGDLGFVLMRFVFTAPDQPPQVEVLDNTGSAKLVRAITAVASQFRLPCASAGKPLRGVQLYTFGNSAPIPTKAATLTLRQLLAVIQPEDRTGIRFDFRTMQCPFSMQVTPYMPHGANRVRELSAPSADRLEFIAWLRGVRFVLPPGGIATLNLQPPKVEVPCAILDLT